VRQGTVADEPRAPALRVQPSVAAKERRLSALLAAAGRVPEERGLAEVVEDAQLLGSLELAGVRASWPEVRASRDAAGGPPEIAALRRARAAVAADAPLTVEAIRAWHAAIAGPAGFRRNVREREDAPTAPPPLIEGRLRTLEEWLSTAVVRDLRPEQAAGLAYARIVEVLPFDEGNGRVARLAASHLMVRAGQRPPILVGADGPYLLACLRAAFRLDTEPLVSLIAEASARALDVVIQALERREA
jgi:hypothetical protein